MSDDLNLGNLFNNFRNESKIFADYHYLTPDFHPQELIGREIQIHQIWNELLYTLRRPMVPKFYFLYGLPGTGKTETMNLLISMLNRWVSESNMVKPLIYFNNCAIYNTPYRILRELCLILKLNIPTTGISIEDVFAQFLRSLKNQKIPHLILILDELDHFLTKKKQADQLLYKFIRFPASKEMSIQISIFGITNDLSLKSSFDSRILSSTNPLETYFPPYSAIELQKILYHRASNAFKPHVLTSGTVELIAAHFAQNDGDCRKAIAVLRTAGEIADRSNTSNVTENHARSALKKYHEIKKQEIINSLPCQSQIILRAIQNLQAKKKNFGYITGDVYNEYNTICLNSNCPVLSLRQFSNHIKNLEKLNLINTERVFRGKGGNSRKITYYFS